MHCVNEEERQGEGEGELGREIKEGKKENDILCLFL